MLMPWINYSYQAALMGFDCQQVIGLRLFKMGQGGPEAGREAVLMVGEKIAAAMDAAMTLASGGSHDKVLRDYRTTVTANLHRLSP